MSRHFNNTIKPKQTRIFVEYRGQQVTLMDLAKVVGVDEDAIRRRYKKGDRGEQLWRPRRRGYGRKEPPAPQRQSAALDDRIVVARLERERREQLRRETQERMRVEHAAAMSAPLIDSKLLTASERKRIYQRVRHSKQAWQDVAEVEAVG